MRSRPRHLGPLALIALLLLAGCAGTSDDAAPAESTPGSLTGLISSIDPAEGEPESFELTRPGEDPRRILIDPDLDYGFDLAHLREHMDDALPVKVTLEDRDGELYATAIEDI